MVRRQVSARKTFPKVRLSAAGTGSLESSEQPAPGKMQAEEWCTMAWMYRG